MRNFVESPAAEIMIAEELSKKQDFSRADDGEPVRAVWRSPIDYGDMAAYVKAWPDKLAAFAVQRLADDDMAAFTRELYEYICQADADGPAFEEWRNT